MNNKPRKLSEGAKAFLVLCCLCFAAIMAFFYLSLNYSSNIESNSIASMFERMKCGEIGGCDKKDK